MKTSEVLELIDNSDKIALVAHVMPDGDTLGSCIALWYVLEKMNKKVEMFCQDDFPELYRFLKGWQYFSKLTKEIESYDLVIAVDCSDRQRLGSCTAVFDQAVNTVNIDHHVSNTYYANVNLVDDKASATGEIVFKLITLLAGKPDLYAAEALYTAIATDTGSFCFSNTTSKTFNICAQLLDCGINIDRLATLLFKSHTLEWIRLLALSLDTLELYYENQIAVMSISGEMIKKSCAKEEDVNGIVNYAINITGVELGILFTETDTQKTKVSFRSKSIIDVSKLAVQFGGGGHKNAAGCTVNKNLSEAKKYVIEVAELLFKEL